MCYYGYTLEDHEVDIGYHRLAARHIFDADSPTLHWHDYHGTIYYHDHPGSFLYDEFELMHDHKYEKAHYVRRDE